MRSSSPKYSSHPLASPRDAGKSLFVIIYLFYSDFFFASIVEFASQEDSHRAIRELSEQPLLGRPVFIREVYPICANL